MSVLIRLTSLDRQDRIIGAVAFVGFDAVLVNVNPGNHSEAEIPGPWQRAVPVRFFCAGQAPETEPSFGL